MGTNGSKQLKRASYGRYAGLYSSPSGRFCFVRHSPLRAEPSHYRGMFYDTPVQPAGFLLMASGATGLLANQASASCPYVGGIRAKTSRARLDIIIAYCVLFVSRSSQRQAHETVWRRITDDPHITLAMSQSRLARFRNTATCLHAQHQAKHRRTTVSHSVVRSR